MRKGKRIKSEDLVNKATNYLKKIKFVKYGYIPEEVDSKTIRNPDFIETYSFHGLLRVNKDADRSGRSDRNKDTRQRKKLRELLDLGEPVFVLGERLKRKDAPGKLYKISTEKKLFFNENKIFIIKKRLFNQTESKYYYSI